MIRWDAGRLPLADESVDAVVCDPPYGLSFMGRKWDYDVPSVAIWQEVFRVLKPGGHLLAFAGTRTQHRMCVNIEDAGFQIRDLIAWVYGSGFPKSNNVSKAIDKAAGAERERLDCAKFGAGGNFNDDNGQTYGTRLSDDPITEAARQWQGWGTALKPALEPITVARKPIIGTVAENVLKYGTGAINVDGCRVGTDVRWNPPVGELTGIGSSRSTPKGDGREVSGRWPANLIHDGSEEVVGLFPQSKSSKGQFKSEDYDEGDGVTGFTRGDFIGRGDSGSAARFFYCAKANKRDRDEGLDVPEKRRTDGRTKDIENPRLRTSPRKNHHPTVKPTDLMRYLCRLITPPGGLVLDPFMGSGSTGKAAVLEGFRFIGGDMSEEYAGIAKARIDHAKANREPVQDAML